MGWAVATVYPEVWNLGWAKGITKINLIPSGLNVSRSNVTLGVQNARGPRGIDRGEVLTPDRGVGFREELVVDAHGRKELVTEEEASGVLELARFGPIGGKSRGTDGGQVFVVEGRK